MTASPNRKPDDATRTHESTGDEPSPRRLWLTIGTLVLLLITLVLVLSWTNEIAVGLPTSVPLEGSSR